MNLFVSLMQLITVQLKLEVKQTNFQNQRRITHTFCNFNFRLIWLAVILSALGVSLYMVLKGVVEPLYANPIIISFESKEITVDQIPFPAFTICNTNKIKKSSVEAATKYSCIFMH